MERKKKQGNRLTVWWLSISIRSKMFVFILLVTLMVLFITLFSVMMVRLYVEEFNIVLGDSYAVNAVLSDFDEQHSAYLSYANYDTAEHRAAYNKAVQQASHSIRALRFSYSGMSLDRYLLTQSLKTAYNSYLQECQTLLRMQQDTASYITQYYYTIKIGDYIKGYIKELLQLTVAEGNDIYYQRVERLRLLPVAAVVMGGLVILFAGLLCTITVRHILNPVLKLADAAREIAVNHLDVPDIRVSNRDEIGDLVVIFNRMKRSTASAITALREKNEMESRLHQEEVQRIHAEKALKTAQMSLLQSQINPHFLFNTLNTISRMAKIEHAEDTAELIQRLANLFRYNLQTASERVTLARELNIINDYIYIQHRRFGDRIGFEIDCRADTQACMVPTFTLQPLVENAVIHGISPKEEGGRIRIRIRQSGETVSIAVTDSGLGMPPERLEKLLQGERAHKGHLSGIGLGNVRARVEMLYPGSRFRIFSRAGMGTSVRIRLPEAMAPGKEENGCITL